MNTEVERAHEKKVVLKHCINGIEHLSFLDRSHMSPIDTIPLPFRGENEIEGSCCRGLFYFNSYDFDSDIKDEEINAVIVNLTTKELKLLPQPIRPADTYNSDTGLGYDPESDDYKVIRIRFGGLTAEVYSLRKDSWKVIPGPGDKDRMDGDCGVYIEGRSSSYWRKRGQTSYPKGFNGYILSFDYRSEAFSRIALPPSLNPPRSKLPGIDTDIRFRVFDCDGFLAVVSYKNVYDFQPRDAKHIELWVHKGGSWERLFAVVLLRVEVPLGLSDGRFLFFEGSPSSCGHSHLMVYDWLKEELREHDVYVKPPQSESFLLLSYLDNTLVLPDATPLINNRLSSGMALKRCSRPQKKASSAPKTISHSLSSGMALKRCTRPQKKNKCSTLVKEGIGSQKK